MDYRILNDDELRYHIGPVTRPEAERPRFWFDSRQRQKIFRFSYTPTSALIPFSVLFSGYWDIFLWA